MIAQIWHKELRGIFFTWKGMAWLVITSLLLSLTSYLLLTNKELSLLDQTEMLWLLSKIIFSAALLVVAIDASSTITSEFDNKTAESLFLAPVSLSDVVWGKFLGSFTLWLAVWLVSLPYILATSAGTHLAATFAGYTLALGSLVVAGLVFFIFAVSLLYRSSRNTLTTSLVVLLAMVAPALFPSGLKGAGVAGALARANPVDGAFGAMDNVLVDYHTSLQANLQFLIPLAVFCIVTAAMLAASMRAFRLQGVIRNG